MYFVWVSLSSPQDGSIIRFQSVWPTTNPMALIFCWATLSSRSAHRTYTKNHNANRLGREKWPTKGWIFRRGLTLFFLETENSAEEALAFEAEVYHERSLSLSSGNRSHSLKLASPCNRFLLTPSRRSATERETKLNVRSSHKMSAQY